MARSGRKLTVLGSRRARMWVRLMPRSRTPPRGRGLCVGKSDLWESPHYSDQVQAVAICNSPCPLIEWCRGEARELRVNGGMVIEGVWGGEIYPSVQEVV